MLEQQTMEVQEGIWLSKSLLEKAGLGSRLQVAIEAGEIRIIAAPPDESETEKQEVKNGQTTDSDFDLMQTRTWELCGAFEVIDPPEEDIVERKETGEIVNNSETEKQEVKNDQTTDDDFDLMQSPLWELCGTLEVINPSEEDIVERKETGEIVTNYAENVDKILYGGS